MPAVITVDRLRKRYGSRRAVDDVSFQVEPGEFVPNQTSIGFSMVGEAGDTDFLIRMLQKYRGDEGGDPLSLDNLTVEEQDRITDIGYTIPSSATRLDQEIDRLDGRLRNLESFFFQVIQLEREIGVASYLRF